MHISQTYEYCDRLKQSFAAHKKVLVVLLRWNFGFPFINLNFLT
jgi:hypothetical protein